MATWIVRARSWAEIPVETPSRASIDTVNAVSNGDSFLAAIRSRPSSSQRSPVRVRQISPRPWVAMKLIASGVANWAAMVRSPSFSRSSASTTTTILPSRMSSMASSIVLKAVCCALIWPPRYGTSVSRRTSPARRPRGSRGRPAFAVPSVVRSSVSGMSETAKVESSTADTVSDTPSMAIEPFSTT